MLGWAYSFGKQGLCLKRIECGVIRQAAQQWQCCVIALAIPCIIELLAQPRASPSGDCGVPLSKRPWNTLYNEKNLCHSERRGGEHHLWHSFNCAPVPVTVRRPGSCSVERSQQLIAQIHSHIQYASLQSGKQGCLQKSRVMIVKTGLIYTSDHGSQGRKGKSHCFCCKLRPYSVKLRAAGFLSGHHQTFNLNRFPKKFSKQMSPTTPQRHINNY